MKCHRLHALVTCLNTRVIALSLVSAFVNDCTQQGATVKKEPISVTSTVVCEQQMRGNYYQSVEIN